MPRSRLDRILACSDPFSLAESIEAYVQTLDAGRLRTLLVDARDRLGPYYRGEIAGILDGGSFAGLDATHYTEIVTRYHSAESLQRTLVAFLKSNLRAVMIFGAPFAAAVVGRLQSRGAVAIGEERPHLFARGAIVAVSALALIAGGAAGERYITQARLSSAALPEPNMAAAQPPIAAAAATSSPRPKPNRLAAVPAAQPAPAPNRSPSPPESTTRLAPVPLRAQASPQPSPETPPTPIPATTIAPTTAPTPTPEPSPLDLTDMPESYSDATPLPEQSVRPAAPPPPHLRVATPKPSPSPHRSWIQRTLNHLDPFKPSASKPSPSPR